MPNASQSKRGFNYQDVVALGYLVKHIKKLDKINDEGKEDVTLLYSNGGVDFLQAKETKRYDYYNSSELRAGLRELINKIQDNKPQRIIYVTNSYYPLGKKVKGCDFTVHYRRYAYNRLSQSARKEIKKQIKQISKIKKDGHYKYDFIHNLVNHDHKRLDSILNLLSITKFSYEGSDNESRLTLVRSYINDFLDDAGLKGASAKNVLHNLYFIINQSSGHNKECISKKQFVTEVFITVAPNESFSKQFFNYCVDDFCDSYLNNKDERDSLKAMYLNRYDYTNNIIYLYEKYRYNNKYKYDPLVTPNRKFVLLSHFVKDDVKELSHILNDSIPSDKQLQLKSNGDKYKLLSLKEQRNKLIETVKYVSWVTIVCHRRLVDIQRAARYENN